MTATPSDAAVAQAFRELCADRFLRASHTLADKVEHRAREIDALSNRELDAGGGSQLSADYYTAGDLEQWFEHPADIVFVNGLKVGDHYELQAINQWTETYEVTKAPDGTSDDYDVRRVQPTTPPAVEGGTPYPANYSGPFVHGVCNTPPGEAVSGLPELPDRFALFCGILGCDRSDAPREMFGYVYGDCVGSKQDLYTAEQMRAYAIEAIAKRGEGGVTISAELALFLYGIGTLEGVGFGEIPDGERAKYWWRKYLPPAPTPAVEVAAWTDDQCLKFASIAFRHAPKNLPDGVTLQDIRMAALTASRKGG